MILHTKNLAQDLAYITPSKCWGPLVSTESSVKSSISTTPPDSVNPTHTEQEASAPLKKTTQLSHDYVQFLHVGPQARQEFHLLELQIHFPL